MIMPLRNEDLLKTINSDYVYVGGNLRTSYTRALRNVESIADLLHTGEIPSRAPEKEAAAAGIGKERYAVSVENILSRVTVRDYLRFIVKHASTDFAYASTSGRYLDTEVGDDYYSRSVFSKFLERDDANLDLPAWKVENGKLVHSQELKDAAIGITEEAEQVKAAWDEYERTGQVKLENVEWCDDVIRHMNKIKSNRFLHFAAAPSVIDEMELTIREYHNRIGKINLLASHLVDYIETEKRQVAGEEVRAKGNIKQIKNNLRENAFQLDEYCAKAEQTIFYAPDASYGEMKARYSSQLLNRQPWAHAKFDETEFVQGIASIADPAMVKGRAR